MDMKGMVRTRQEARNPTFVSGELQQWADAPCVTGRDRSRPQGMRVAKGRRMRTFLCLLLVACGSSEHAAGGGASTDGGVGCLASNECPTGFVCNDFGQCEMPGGAGSGSGSSGPAETEIELGAPISAQRYVYVAMTDQDELARIDGVTLAVTATPVGKAPRNVATIPGSDGAVVLDSDNGTATIVRPAGASDSIRVLPTLQHLNRIDIDPTGAYAVAWFDLQKAIADGGITGIGSFQDVSVIDLANNRAVDLTVGFRPRNVQFDAAGTHAYVVTQDGVSAIDLAYATGQGASIVPPIAVADPSVSPDDLEVRIVSTGAYAAVRQAGLSAVRIVDLANGAAREVPLGSPATDIDLAPDGSRVYAVARDAGQLAIIDVAAATAQTIDLGDGVLGSLEVSRDGTRALLYTNATLDERITMVKLDQPGFPHATWHLQKAVRAVGISPNSATAVLLDAKAPGDPATAGTVDEYIDESYGYTLLDLATGFSKLQLTPVDPGPFAYAPDGSKAYVALDGGDDATATRALQLVATKTGVVTTMPLGSPPSAVGILPVAAQAFAAQRHPLGRVSFVALDTDAVRTVTGFDLNSHVVQ
jgi:DNA-binding beta-propeller fold protein YncE